MEDREILRLFWQRSESALAEVQKKYGRMLRKIAAKIAGSETAAEECLNDTLAEHSACAPREYSGLFLQGDKKSRL